MGEGGHWSYTLFKLDGGRLVPDFTLGGHGTDIDFMTYFIYKHLSAASDEQEHQDYRKSLTEEEHDSLVVQYGLDDFVDAWWNGREDETEHILSMSN